MGRQDQGLFFPSWLFRPKTLQSGKTMTFHQVLKGNQAILTFF